MRLKESDGPGRQALWIRNAMRRELPGTHRNLGEDTKCPMGCSVGIKRILLTSQSSGQHQMTMVCTWNIIRLHICSPLQSWMYMKCMSFTNYNKFKVYKLLHIHIFQKPLCDENKHWNFPGPLILWFTVNHSPHATPNCACASSLWISLVSCHPRMLIHRQVLDYNKA